MPPYAENSPAQALGERFCAFACGAMNQPCCISTDVEALTLSNILHRIPQRKPWGSMSANVVVALDLASEDPARRAALLDGTPGGVEGEQQASQLIDQLLQ